MQHQLGTTKLRKFRGQQPTGPAVDSETQVVSALCLMSLGRDQSSLSRDQSSLVLYHKIHCRAVYIEKDKHLTPAPVLHLITGMDQNEPEWASITKMGITIHVYLFYATRFIILP